MARLDIAISTHSSEGLQRVAEQQLPVLDGVRYVVSWQEHCDKPIPHAIAERGDITVSRFELHGQSNNRNNALALCTADLVIIADDDVSYSEAGIRQALKFMEARPDTAVFTFIVERPCAPEYPPAEHTFNGRYPRNYHIGACEIALRRSKIGNLCFHPAFGLNSPDMHGGEDELFHLTAMRRGLECRFAPIVIGSHPHFHTGFGKALSPQTLRAQACIATLMYPYSFVPRLLLKTIRLKKAGMADLRPSLRFFCSGIGRALRLRRSDRERLW